MEQFILRPYQAEDVEIMTKWKRVLNANSPGLGKTIESLCTINNWGVADTLVLGPKIATGVWKAEAAKWFDWNSIIYTGTPAQRKKIEDQWFKEKNTHILITNIAQLKNVLAFQSRWKNVVVDEIHLLGLLNHKNKAHATMKKLQYENIILLTGTPVRKNPADLFAPLQLLDSKTFTAYWRFVNHWCIVCDGMFGKEIMSRPKNPLEMKKMLSRYMIRHTQEEVLKDLPEKTRQVLPVTMNTIQEKAYRELVDEMILELRDDVIIASSVLTLNLRLRQLLIEPRMLGLDTDGAALEGLVNELIPADFDEGNSVAICTPFKLAIPFIRQYLIEKIPDVQVFEIHGGIKQNAFDVAEAFQKCQSVKKVILYTIKSGASWTAHQASVAYFLGCEWSLTENEQAEARIYRIGQQKPCRFNYMLHSGTVEDLVVAAIENKQTSVNWVLSVDKMVETLKQEQQKYKKGRGRK